MGAAAGGRQRHGFAGARRLRHEDPAAPLQNPAPADNAIAYRPISRPNYKSQVDQPHIQSWKQNGIKIVKPGLEFKISITFAILY
jgi:hypothetical protein